MPIGPAFLLIVLVLSSASGLPQRHATEKLLSWEHLYRETPRSRAPAELRSQSSVRIAKQKVRLDGTSKSAILLADTSQFFLVDHRTEEVYPFEIPLDRFGLMEPELRSFLQPKIEGAALQVISSRLVEPQTTSGPWNAQRYEIELASRDQRLRETVEIWMSPDVSLETDLYWQMIHIFNELTLDRVELWDHIASLGGFPVRIDLNGGGFSGSSRLLAIEDCEPEPGAFEPPSDYEMMPLGSSQVFITRPDSLAPTRARN